jgi:hypothetical protein
VVYEPTAPTAPGLTNSQPIIPADRWTSINGTLNSLISKVIAPPGIYPLDTSKTYQNIDIWGINGHLEWNLGPATLTVIPAYQHVKLDLLVMPALYFSTTNYFTGAPSTSDAERLKSVSAMRTRSSNGCWAAISSTRIRTASTPSALAARPTRLSWPRSTLAPTPPLRGDLFADRPFPPDRRHALHR